MMVPIPRQSHCPAAARTTPSAPMRRLTLLACLCVPLLAGCDGGAQAEKATRASTPNTLVASGSSTVYPLTLEAASRFERSRPDAHVDVSFTGTSAGFRKFCKGETDINNASRPINEEESALCASNEIRYLALPVAMDAVSIVVHPSNTWVADISVAELARLWSPAAEGKLKTWRDIRDSWPDKPIVLFGRGQDSGTYDYFTTAIVGTTRASRSDYTASEDEEFLAGKIAEEPNALGFFGIGGYHRHWNELKLVAVADGGAPVFPTLETVKRGEYTPLARPLFLYVNRDSLGSKPDLGPFVTAYLEGIRSWIHFTGYMPLDAGAYDEGVARLREGS